MCSNLLVNQTSFFGIIKKTEEKIKYDRPSNEERGQFSTGQNCHRTVAGEDVPF